MSVFYVTVLGDETKWVWCPQSDYDRYQLLEDESNKAITELKVMIYETSQWARNLEAERDEARTWARRLLAELHRVTDEREAMRSQLQALAEAASYTTPTD